MIPIGYFSETQLICNSLSVDGIHDPEILSINAASAALAVSDIPWNGPVAAVRVGLIDGEIVINATRREMSRSLLNLVVSSARPDLVVMLEASAENIAVQHFQDAIAAGVKECQLIVAAIDNLRALHGKRKREFIPPAAPSQELLAATKVLSANSLRDILRNFSLDKIGRDVAVQNVRASVVERLAKSFPTTDAGLIGESFNKFYKDLFRSLIFEDDIRLVDFEFSLDY